jgi:hypothetical protein
MAPEKEPTPTANVLYPPEPKQPASEWVSVDRAIETVLQPREAELANELGLSTVERAKEKAESTDMLRKSGLDPYGVGAKIIDLSIDARLAQLRSGGDVDEEELNSRILRNNADTRQELAGTFGREEAERLIALADKWVRTQPKLHALLGTNGMGSRPDVVIPIVEHIRRIGWKG